MYLNHFGFSDYPFKNLPDTRVFYDGADRGGYVDCLMFDASDSDDIALVTGDVGVGKTTLTRAFIERRGSQNSIIWLCNPMLKPDALLQVLGRELGLPPTPSERLLRDIEECLIQRATDAERTLLLIDEAHLMPDDSLETVRLLSNIESAEQKLLKIILVGQPELADRLKSPAMRALNSRIRFRLALHPLPRENVKEYLLHRLARHDKHRCTLTDEAIRAMAHHSKGVFRDLNMLADRALLACFVEQGYRLEHTHVKRAALEMEWEAPEPFEKTVAPPSSRQTLTRAAAGGFLLGFCVWATAHMFEHPLPLPAPAASVVNAGVGSEGTKPEHAEHPGRENVASANASLTPQPAPLQRTAEVQSKEALSPGFAIQMAFTPVESEVEASAYASALRQNFSKTSPLPSDWIFYVQKKNGGYFLGAALGDFASKSEAEKAFNELKKVSPSLGFQLRTRAALEKEKANSPWNIEI